jgi:signal transduction histidine kinase/ActR/RegA family two-component response regulator
LLGQAFGYPLVNKTTEIDIIKKNGTSATGEMRIAETEWQGEFARIVTIQDITYRKINEKEKKELESQLQQAQKMESIGTLAGGIAHDFNNILSAIIGFSELAMDRTDKDSDIRDDLSEVLNAGNRAKELVKQILAFSRQTDHEPKPVRTDTIIKEVARLIRSTLPSTISIQTSIETSGQIMADPTRIHQVLMNLCTNAYHAMHDTGGTLSIRLTAVSVQPDHTPPVPEMLPGNYINISIADTGIGIPLEIIPRIFDPYFTTKGQGEGTGLGLAVTHGVIKSHNGHIMVESEMGRGTSFHIYFPAIKQERDLSAAEPAAELPRGTERILFVDDELPILKVNKIRLERLGYHVTALSRSKDAIDLFAAQPDDFDLIITDMTMPELTGDALAKECIRVRSDIPIILCTGYSDIISETQAQKIGIREYVMKPILVKNLAEAIRRAVGEE